MLTLKLSDLIFTYEKNNQNLTCKEYWEEEGEAFDKTNSTDILCMITEVCRLLNIDDLYGAKRMEATIHTDAPMFAWNRRLLKNWLVDNFQY